MTGLARESYIDGVWNKESVEDWLAEIQFPVKFIFMQNAPLGIKNFLGSGRGFFAFYGL